MRHLLCVDIGTTDALNSTQEVAHYWEIAHYGGPLHLTTNEGVLASLGIMQRDGADQWRYEDALFYDW